MSSLSSTALQHPCQREGLRIALLLEAPSVRVPIMMPFWEARTWQRSRQSPLSTCKSPRSRCQILHTCSSMLELGMRLRLIQCRILHSKSGRILHPQSL